MPEASINMSLSLKEKTRLCCKIVLDKKAYDLVVLDLKEYTSVTDYFIICSASSTTQVQAIADEITEKLKKNNVVSNGIEGYSNARWVLIDFADLVIHIFHEEARRFYDLERLWGNAPNITLEI